MRLVALFGLLTVLLTSCHCGTNDLNPCISYTPQKRCVNALPAPFTPLTKEERATDWGKELTIAAAFAKDLDLYRAITTYKRALALSPPQERAVEIEYSIALSYFLGKKYCEVVNTVEESELINIQKTFPAYRDLLIMLYECYETLGFSDRACRVLLLLEEVDGQAAQDLPLSTAIRRGDLKTLSYHKGRADIDELFSCYCPCAKDPHTARALAAILPGAGYLYVGQCQSAITSFLINTLFVWAAVRFFDQGHTAAGIITAGLEAGWYLGGIHGSALAAKEYNERLFEGCGKETMLSHCLFPVLMLNKSF